MKPEAMGPNLKMKPEVFMDIVNNLSNVSEFLHPMEGVMEERKRRQLEYLKQNNNAKT